MPKPELYVIYTGDRKSVPDTITLRKEFFGGEKIAIDVEVNVLYQENEQILRAYAKDIEEHATHREARETAERMIKDREMSLEKIARYVPTLTMEELRKLEAEIMQLA